MPIPAGGQAAPVVPWAPTLVKVADRIPGRTLVAHSVDGSNTQEFTFDASTRPTDFQVLRLIDDSVAWVLSATGPTIDPTLTGLATAAASVYTAASIEQGYPERELANEKDAAVTAKALFAQAQDMLTKLAARNEVLVGQDPGVFETVPAWSFPPGLPDDFGFIPSIF